MPSRNSRKKLKSKILISNNILTSSIKKNRKFKKIFRLFSIRKTLAEKHTSRINLSMRLKKTKSTMLIGLLNKRKGSLNKKKLRSEELRRESKLCLIDLIHTKEKLKLATI